MKRLGRASSACVSLILTFACTEASVPAPLPHAGRQTLSSDDPSIVVTTATELALGGNLEGGAELDVAGERVKRGSTRLTVGNWGTTTPVPTGRTIHASVAYNGYLYVTGGVSATTYLSDVRVAPFVGDTVGGFMSTTSLPSVRAHHTAVAYNGYLYIIGGVTVPSAALAEIRFARINADGTLGAFGTTTPLPAPRYLHTSVAYNGRLYVIGGTDATNVSPDIHVAAFNADGTLGAFTATTPLPNANASHASVVYDGYLYIVGGGPGTSNTVLVARINADGTLGAFTATSSFATARYSHAAVAWHGALYVLGGTNTASAVLSDVQVARINSNGTLGAFITTNNFPTARGYHQSLAWNGNLYLIGGTNSSGGVLSDVRWAPLNSNAGIGAWTTTAMLPTARRDFAMETWNGYLYVLGGYNTGYLAEVLVTPMNADGTLGALTTTTPLPTPRAFFASAVYNGRVYVVGGGSAAGDLNEVSFAPINADGTLGAFTATTPFSAARHGHTAVATAGYLYVIGGEVNANPRSDVQVAPINANGTLGAFTTTTAFPNARLEHASVVFGGRLYIAGGMNGGLTWFNDIVAATINANGTLGGFATVGSLPDGRSDHSLTVVNRSAYLLGGLNGPGSEVAAVSVAAISSSGSIGTFLPTTSLPTTLIRHKSVAFGGRLFTVGGYNGSTLTTIQSAPLHATGGIGAFTAGSPFATGRHGHASVAYGNNLYVLGGWSNAYEGDVQYAPLWPNGTMGPFTATTSLPSARRFLGAAAYQGRMYVSGGTNGSDLDDVHVAPILSNGTLGTFAPTSTFATARNGHGSAAYGGHFYIVGGMAGTTPLADVQVAPINADGTLGAFSPTSSFATARANHTTVISDGRLYVIGGWNGTSNLGDVQVAAIASDGTLGAFTTVASLTAPRRFHASAVHGGYLFVVGGQGTTSLSEVLVAPIFSDGSVGDFSATSALPSARYGSAAAISNGLMYVSGGFTGAMLNEVRVAPLLTPPPVARYSRLVDLVTPTGLNTLTVNGSAVNGQTRVEYRTAPASGVLGPTTDLGAVPLGAPVPLFGSNVRYVWLRFTLDDTLSASVNADAPGARDLTAFTLDTGTTLTVTPASATLPPMGMQTFACSGGAGSGYTFAVNPNNSGGSVNPGSGAYVAGAIGGVSDVVTCDDGMGGHGSAVVMVTATLALMPGSVTRPPRGSVTFTAVGGSGTGITFAPITDRSGMTIGTTSGAYTAGSVGGVLDVVGVTDSLGNTATATVTVTAGVTLSPMTPTAPPRGAVVFTAMGGSGTGFSWNLTSNASGATLDAGTYRAGVTPSVMDILQATDSLGNVGVATITVGPGVTAAPASATIAPRGMQAFTATGGSGTGFTWSLQTNASGGSVSPAGSYTAGTVGSVIDVVRVTDSLGNVDTVNVTVSPAISIAPASPSTPPMGMIAFGASGGSGTGFMWSLGSTGSVGATINAMTGAYRAGTQNGTDVVRVTDSFGNTASVNVTVTNALAVTPGMVTLPPLGTQTFTGSGGAGTGFMWSLLTNASGASFDTQTASYRAGRDGGVVDVVQLRDAFGNTATATINVGPGVAIAPATAAIAPMGSVAFTVTGGSATGFAWSLQTNGSGGAIDASGMYTAGPTGGTIDVVRVVDSLGNSATAQVSVGAGLTISPAALSVAPRQAVSFSAMGGNDTGFSWRFVTNASMGTLNPGTGMYRAGNVGSVTDVVQVSDSLGNTARRNVTVTAGVSIAPASPTVAPRATQQLVATGGSGTGYAWSFVTNRSGGTLATTSGLYQAGALGGVTDVVHVVDSLGNSATAMVQVTGALAVSPANPTVAPLQAVAFSASGGAGGVHWRLATNGSGGSIDADTGSYVAGATGGTTDTVEATDVAGGMATSTVTVTNALVVSPPTVSVPPRGQQAFMAAGGSGAGYAFSLATNASGGAIDSATGVYTAGPAASVIDVVQVTDGAGGTATAMVTVTGGVVITPVTATVQSGEHATFMASGGSGSGYTWRLSQNGSQGQIEPASGEYVAGMNGDVMDEVEVSDALGNLAHASVTVTPAQKGCGCQADASGLLPLGLALLSFCRRRRAR